MCAGIYSAFPQGFCDIMNIPFKRFFVNVKKESASSKGSIYEQGKTACAKDVRLLS
jgi:hypothetical protein